VAENTHKVLIPAYFPFTGVNDFMKDVLQLISVNEKN
jgi:hypothetical protein